MVTERDSGSGMNYRRFHRGLTLVGIPLLFWNYTRISDDSGQVLFLLVLVSLVFASRVLSHHDRRRNGMQDNASLLPLMWTGACALYGTMIVWNHFFRQEILATAYRGDIFRQIYWNYWAPLYGHPEIPSPFDFLLIAALAAALYTAMKFYGERLAKADAGKILALLAAVNLILIVAFALSQSEARLLHNIYDYKNFGTRNDLLLFNTLEDVWKKWNTLMPALHGRNPHYPPGNLFILKAEQMYGVPGLLKVLVITATLLCVPLLYYLGRTLGMDRKTAFLAVALFVTSASPTIFPTTSLTPVTMFFSLLAYLGFFSAVKGGSWRGAALCGVSLALYSLLSFSVFIVGLSIFLIGLAYFCLTGDLRFNIGKTGVLTGLVFLASLLLVYALTGFNLWLCLIQSIHQNTHLMTANPFDTAPRYLLRSTGNILAYLLFTGIVPASLAMAGWLRLPKAPRKLGIFMAASLATLLAAGFSGLFFMETERIWVFFTPFLALSAAWGVRCHSYSDIRPDSAGLLVMTGFLATAVQEICFQHYWN